MYVLNNCGGYHMSENRKLQTNASTPVIAPRKVYVIGHKNPDTDSICSAIAYADIKRRTEPYSVRSPLLMKMKNIAL